MAEQQRRTCPSCGRPATVGPAGEKSGRYPAGTLVFYSHRIEPGRWSATCSMSRKPAR